MNNPLIVHIAAVDAAHGLAHDWPPLAEQLAVRFWPGPLTLVVRKSAQVPGIVTADGPTVGLRMPAHPVALALLRECGLPIAAPSANRSTGLSPTEARHVLNDLEGRIDLILDAGPTTGGVESTVLDVTVEPPCLLRPGLITPAELEAVIGPVVLVGKQPATPNQPLRSPGLRDRHYAPKAVLEIVVGPAWQRVQALLASGYRVGWVTHVHPVVQPPGVLIERMPTGPKAYAAKLYATLHQLDAAGIQVIIVDAVPDTNDWLAIRDRLTRAACREPLAP